MTFRVVWLLLVVSPLFPQILYNEQRDKQAQEVQKLGAELQNSSVFQKALITSTSYGSRGKTAFFGTRSIK